MQLSDPLAPWVGQQRSRGANAEDKGHSPEQGDSFPMAFLDKEEINHIHLL